MGEQSNIVAYNFTATDQLSPVLQAQAQALQQLATATTSHQAALSSLLTLTGQLANAQQQQAQTVTQGAAATQQAVQSTAGMAQAFQALAAQGTQTQQALSGVLALSQQLANAQQQTTAAVTAQTAAIGQLTTALNQAHTAQQAVVTSTTQAGSALNIAYGVAGGLGIAVGIQLIVSQLKQLATASLDASLQRESLVASFRGITGGAKETAETLNFLRETARRSGADFITLAESFKDLEASARGTKVTEDSLRTLFQGLVAQGRVLDLTDAQLRRAFVAISQIITANRISGQELLQLVNAIPGSVAVLSRALGRSGEDFKALIKSGVDASTTVDRLGKQLVQEFGPGLELAAQKSSSSFKLFFNEVRELGADFGDSISSALKSIADTATSLLVKFRETRQEFARQKNEAPAGFSAIPTLTGGGGGSFELANARSILEVQQNILKTFREQNANKAFDLKNVIPSGEGIPQDTLIQRAARNTLRRVRGALSIEEALAKQEALVAKLRAEYDALLASQQAVVAPTTQAQAPFSNQTKLIEKALEDLKFRLAELEQLNTLFPSLFPGDDGQEAKAERRLGILRKAAEDIAEQVSKGPPGLAAAIPEDQKARFAAINEELGLNLKLQEVAKARVETAREFDGILKRSSTEQNRQAEEEKRKRDAAIEQLGRISGQLDFPTTEKATAGLTDQLAVVEANFPTDEQIGRQAEALRQRLQERELANEIVPELKNYFKAEQDLDELKGKAEKTQTRLNNAIERALQLAQAPREERTETRLRREFAEAGVTPTPAEDARINFTTVVNQRRLEAERTADIYRDLGRTIESNLQNAFESAFTFGAQSGESLALSLAKSFQSLFAQLASQTTLNLLLRLLGQEPGGKSGGATGAILQGLVKFGVGLFAGGSGGNYGGLSQGFDTASQPYSFASGGVATRPQMAFVGDNRSGFGEAIIPLSRNRAVPVELSGGGSSRAEQPIIVQVLVNNDYKGSIDPRALRTTPGEITSVVAKNISTDGNLRQVIMQYAR